MSWRTKALLALKTLKSLALVQNPFGVTDILGNLMKAGTPPPRKVHRHAQIQKCRGADINCIACRVREAHGRAGTTSRPPAVPRSGKGGSVGRSGCVFGWRAEQGRWVAL